MDGPYYRNRAREIRAEAEHTITLWVRNQLREIADRYELLAIEADRAARLSSNQETTGGSNAELFQQASAPPWRRSAEVARGEFRRSPRPGN